MDVEKCGRWVGGSLQPPPVTRAVLPETWSAILRFQGFLLGCLFVFGGKFCLFVVDGAVHLRADR